MPKLRRVYQVRRDGALHKRHISIHDAIIFNDLADDTDIDTSQSGMVRCNFPLWFETLDSRCQMEMVRRMSHIFDLAEDALEK